MPGNIVELDGKRYSHILDPHTGLGLTDRSLVIVVARDGISADSLTKAVAVLGPGRGLELLAEYPDAAALVLRPVDGKIQIEESHNFKSFEVALENGRIFGLPRPPSDACTGCKIGQLLTGQHRAKLDLGNPPTFQTCRPNRYLLLLSMRRPMPLSQASSPPAAK